MHVVIAGAHGQIARRLTRRLSADGHRVTGLVRNPAHSEDVVADGAEPVVLDLEDAQLADVTAVLARADAAVFAAGAGAGSGIDRKDTVDRAAAVILADAAVSCGVRRHVQISSLGTESVRRGGAPEGMDEVFEAYLRAKRAAEDHLRTTALEWVILRPGHLTDDAGTGTVRLVDRTAGEEPPGDASSTGKVSRDDVAAVIHALLQKGSGTRRVLELTNGRVPIADAVAAIDSA